MYLYFLTALSNRLDSDMEKLVEEHMEKVLKENKSNNKSNNKKKLKRRFVSPPSPSGSPSGKNGMSSGSNTSTEIDVSLNQMKCIIEDFTDRKAQLSINAYDIIDQHIRVVDEEIKLLETAIRLAGAEVPPVPSAGDMEEMYGGGNHKKRKKKNGKGEDEASLEPVYCLCQQTNYGDMIRCDSDDCMIEWFHYPCVGLTKEPVKRWLCPDCSKQKK